MKQYSWALITGASRGIGFHLALFMARQGYNLLLHSRSTDHLQEIQHKVQALGVQSHLLAADLADTDAIDAMLHTIDQLPLSVDVIFNNAGIQVAHRDDYYAASTTDYDLSFRINTIAPIRICCHFLPKMIQKGHGRIINTTSGIQNVPEQSAYAASKAALDKATTDLASTLKGTDIVLTLADPGWCQTDMGGSGAPNTVHSALPGVALGAFAPPSMNGRRIHAQHYSGMDLDTALQRLNDLKLQP